MGPLTRIPAAVQNADCFTNFEDFYYDQTDLFWVDTVTDLGTVAIDDAAGGVATLTPSDGTVADNDEAYFATANELFLPANGKPMIFGWYVKFAEAATNAANVAVGVANAPAANLLIDDGGGLRASGTLAAIYKVDGSTVWKCTSRNQSTANINTTAVTAGGTAYQYLEVEFVDFDSTQCKVFFRYGTGPNDTKPFLDSTTLQPIFHYMLYASATEMAQFLAVKNGSANQQTLLCDYAWFSCKR